MSGRGNRGRDGRGGRGRRGGRGDDNQGKKPIPTTKQGFLDEGAIEKPQDGPNAKKPGQKCLTCISLGGNCIGTEVKNGRCRSCNGIPLKQKEAKKSSARKRICLWRDDKNNVGTYREAQDFHQTRRNPANTVEGRASRGVGTDTQVYPSAPDYDTTEAEDDGVDVEDEQQTDAVDTIFDLTPANAEYNTVGEVVAELVNGGQAAVSPMLNLERMMDIVQNRHDGAGDLAVYGTRENAERVQNILNSIYYILRQMYDREDDFRRADLYSFLPNNHSSRHTRG